jgi:hypothetical protein
MGSTALRIRLRWACTQWPSPDPAAAIHVAALIGQLGDLEVRHQDHPTKLSNTDSNIISVFMRTIVPAGML